MQCKFAQPIYSSAPYACVSYIVVFVFIVFSMMLLCTAGCPSGCTKCALDGTDAKCTACPENQKVSDAGACECKCTNV